MNDTTHRTPPPAPDPPEAVDRRLEALLRTVGPRPAIDPDRTARVRRAVHAAWEETHARPQRRRRTLRMSFAAAAAVGLVAIALWRWTGVHSPQIAPIAPLARVERVVGTARVSGTQGNASAAPLAPGDVIASGQAVETGPGARVALLATSRHSIRLDESSRLIVLADDSFELASGAVYVQSSGENGPADGTVEIRTALGVVTETGTQYEVRLEGAGLRLRVREGGVRLAMPQHVRTISAGRELTVQHDGSGEERAIDAASPEWAWAAGVASPPAIDGRRLGEFLQWAAREKGVRPRYEGAELARTAPGIVLSGSIEGMTPDEALESVLATCGLRSRIEGDSLIIESR